MLTSSRSRAIGSCPSAALALIVFSGFPVSLEAYFIDGYAKWQQMTNAQRSAYVMGVIDESLTPWQNSNADLAHAFGVSRCSDELDITNTMIVDAVENWYLNNLSSWNLSASLATQQVLNEICFQFINDARSEHDLPPMTVP